MDREWCREVEKREEVKEENVFVCVEGRMRWREGDWRGVGEVRRAKERRRSRMFGVPGEGGGRGSRVHIERLIWRSGERCRVGRQGERRSGGLAREAKTSLLSRRRTSNRNRSTSLHLDGTRLESGSPSQMQRTDVLSDRAIGHPPLCQHHHHYHYSDKPDTHLIVLSSRVVQDIYGHLHSKISLPCDSSETGQTPPRRTGRVETYRS